MALALYPHQREGVDFMASVHGGVLLADEMGTGKTSQVATLIKEQALTPALIVCPASVKNNWGRELASWAAIHDTYIVEGQTPVTLPSPMPKAVIVNYDILHHQADVLSALRWGCIAFDECHTLGDRTSKRTRAAMRVARRSTKVIGISGTPITNRPADFWPILHIIRPDLFPAWLAYGHRYCGPKRVPWSSGFEFKGASNLEELHAKIKPFMLRRKKDILGLPEKRRIIVPMDVENPDMLKEAEEDFLNWLQQNRRYGNVHKVRQAEAVSKLGILFRLTGQQKCRSVVKWGRDFLEQNPGEKLILFSTHKAMIDVLERRVHPEGVVKIDGSVQTKKRQPIVDAFQHDPKIRLMVANLKAAGVGITLTSAANVAMTELWWTSSVMAQAEDRIHRVTQSRDCSIYYLLVPGSVEESLCKAIQTKQKIANAVIDGKKDNSMPVLDMLLEQHRGLMKNARPAKT